MKKYLEQRIEELELEVKALKAKLNLNEITDTSKYINNYSKYDPFKDYIYNSSVNFMHEPELETAFASSFDESLLKKNTLNTITVKQTDHLDSDNENNLSILQNKAVKNYPPYPDIIGSWDDFPENINDKYEFKVKNVPVSVTPWGFISGYDKTDNDSLNN